MSLNIYYKIVCVKQHFVLRVFFLTRFNCILIKHVIEYHYISWFSIILWRTSQCLWSIDDRLLWSTIVAVIDDRCCDRRRRPITVIDDRLPWSTIDCCDRRSMSTLVDILALTDCNDRRSIAVIDDRCLLSLIFLRHRFLLQMALHIIEAYFTRSTHTGYW